MYIRLFLAKLLRGDLLNEKANRKNQGRKRRLATNSRMALFFHTPTFLILSLITLGPVVYTIYLSFFNYSLSSPGSQHQFIWFQNYVKVLTNPEFFSSMFVTFKFVLISVAVQTVLGFGIAMIIYSLKRGQRVLTALVMVPMMVAPLVIGLMYSFSLNPQFGIYAYIIDTLNLPLPVAPLSQANSALLVICITDIWEWTPYMFLMMLAGLQSLPVEPFEAARVDGANAFQIFHRITLPLMKPIVAVALILRAVEAFKEFDKPYILTGGGPGSATDVIDMYTYRQAFVNYNYSYAATICVVLFIILLAVGIAYGKLVLERGKNEKL